MTFFQGKYRSILYRVEIVPFSSRMILNYKAARLVVMHFPFGMNV